MATKKSKNSDGVASRLQDLMDSRKLTRSDLARSLGVSNAHVANWLSGQQPRAEQILSISRVFGVRMEWLLTGEGCRTPEEVFAYSNAWLRQQGVEPDESPEALEKSLRGHDLAEYFKSRELLREAAEKRAEIAERKLHNIRNVLRKLTKELDDET